MHREVLARVSRQMLLERRARLALSGTLPWHVTPAGWLLGSAASFSGARVGATVLSAHALCPAGSWHLEILTNRLSNALGTWRQNPSWLRGGESLQCGACSCEECRSALSRRGTCIHALYLYQCTACQRCARCASSRGSLQSLQDRCRAPARVDSFSMPPVGTTRH